MLLRRRAVPDWLWVTEVHHLQELAASLLYGSEWLDQYIPDAEQHQLFCVPGGI